MEILPRPLAFHFAPQEAERNMADERVEKVYQERTDTIL